MLVAKYGWHLPLYRLEKMSRQGIEIDRSTLAFWVVTLPRSFIQLQRESGG